MPFRFIFFSFAKCEHKGEVAGHENMTLTRRMAHARIELHKKIRFNDGCFNIFFKPFSHVCGSRQFDTFSVDIFDTYSGTRQFDTFSVGMFDTFSGPTLDTFSGPTLDTFSGPTFDTFSVDLTHLAE